MDLLFIDSGKIEYYNAKKDVLSLKKVFFAKKEVLLSRFCVTKEKTKQQYKRNLPFSIGPKERETERERQDNRANKFNIEEGIV